MLILQVDAGVGFPKSFKRNESVLLCKIKMLIPAIYKRLMN